MTARVDLDRLKGIAEQIESANDNWCHDDHDIVRDAITELAELRARIERAPVASVVKQGIATEYAGGVAYFDITYIEVPENLISKTIRLLVE